MNERDREMKESEEMRRAEVRQRHKRKQIRQRQTMEREREKETLQVGSRVVRRVCFWLPWTQWVSAFGFVAPIGLVSLRHTPQVRSKVQSCIPVRLPAPGPLWELRHPPHKKKDNCRCRMVLMEYVYIYIVHRYMYIYIYVF